LGKNLTGTAVEDLIELARISEKKKDVTCHRRVKAIDEIALITQLDDFFLIHRDERSHMR
jgi:hypothetical protein